MRVRVAPISALRAVSGASLLLFAASTGALTWLGQARPADAGVSWVVQTSGTNANLTAISCPTAATCFAVGSGGTILATSDAGAHWIPQFCPDPNFGNPLPCPANLTSVACPTVTVCWAVGGTYILHTTTGGVMGPAAGVGGVPGGWTIAVNDPSASFTSITCPTAEFCEALDSKTNSVFAGGSGAPPGLLTDWVPEYTGVPTSNPLLSVSCSDVVFCVAVAANEVVATNGGGSVWSVQSTGVFGLTSVHCAGARHCVAGGSGGNIWVGSYGTGWWEFNNAATLGAYNSISCPDGTLAAEDLTSALSSSSQNNALLSSGECWGVDQYGGVTRFDGRQLPLQFNQDRPDPTPTTELNAIGCAPIQGTQVSPIVVGRDVALVPTDPQCWAVGNAGYIIHRVVPLPSPSPIPTLPGVSPTITPPSTSLPTVSLPAASVPPLPTIGPTPTPTSLPTLPVPSSTPGPGSAACTAGTILDTTIDGVHTLLRAQQVAGGDVWVCLRFDGLGVGKGARIDIDPNLGINGLTLNPPTLDGNASYCGSPPSGFGPNQLTETMHPVVQAASGDPGGPNYVKVSMDLYSGTDAQGRGNTWLCATLTTATGTTAERVVVTGPGNPQAQLPSVTPYLDPGTP